MKSLMTAVALLGTLVICPAWANAQAQAPVSGTAQPGASRFFQRGATDDPGALNKPTAPAAGAAPELTPPSELKPPTIALPNEPIEPYLLTKANGPFMVLAKTFRGPVSERMALALAKELRNDFGLPAYILRRKDFPGGSMIRGTPPTVPSEVMAPDIKMPEKIRTLDEASVLVGNEKTLAGSEKLWREVKKLKPKCLAGMSSPYPWRTGLSSALRTTNPFVPAQNLYPRPADKLVIRMNAGLRSVGNCPGNYSLQVADFSGRSQFQFNTQQPAFHLLNDLKNSPLRKAHDDAERMADKLARAPEIQRLGQPIYVYHDRTSSKVFIGSFNAPQDPGAVALRQQLVDDAYELTQKRRKDGSVRKEPLDMMIVPAVALTELSPIKSKIRE
jgi:hypothetical protein